MAGAETRNELALVRDTYDRVAAQYSAAFLGELANKPLDRALLQLFADQIHAEGHVADLGTGSGQIARFLSDQRQGVTGIDLAPAMIAEARRQHPGVAFEVGDMLRLSHADGYFAGLTAFYAIVHLTRAELRPFFRESLRVLVPGGRVLFSFHVGEETLQPSDFLGSPCPIAWNFFSSDEIAIAATATGFEIELRLERTPYPSEHPSTRGYMMLKRP